MKNIMIEIEYDGTNYCGWQRQQCGRTVQDKITKALKKLTGKNITVHGSGRTDSGVHARGQVANFKLENNIPVEDIPSAINRYLPYDISITGAAEVPMDFHARFSAIGKRYVYHIYENRHRSPILRNYSYHVHYKLDHDKIIEASKVLIGTHDFNGFMTSRGTEVHSTIRTIQKLEIIKDGKSLYINVEGDGFLYNMVRIIAGCLVDIGRGKMPVNQMKKILESKDRAMASATAPAHGLFLDKVFYPLTHEAHCIRMY